MTCTWTCDRAQVACFVWKVSTFALPEHKLSDAEDTYLQADVQISNNGMVCIANSIQRTQPIISCDIHGFCKQQRSCTNSLYCPRSCLYAQKFWTLESIARMLYHMSKTGLVLEHRDRIMATWAMRHTGDPAAAASMIPMLGRPALTRLIQQIDVNFPPCMQDYHTRGAD